MYTEFVFGARLKKDTPPHIIEMLKVMFRHNERLPEKYSDWNDKFPNIRTIPFGGSYYFAVQDGLSRLSHDKISEDWTVCIRCNIKNYEDHIMNFMKWLEPYVANGSGNLDFLGYSLYEEDDTPILYYLNDGKVVR